VRGTAFAAVADIRPDSQTFGEVATFWLGDPPGEPIALFLADGLANAYAVPGEDEVDYLYAVSEAWHPVDKRAIAWDDPDLGVAWPVDAPILSDADRANPRLRDRFPDHPRFAGDVAWPAARGIVRLLVTGGAGFIGSNFVRWVLGHTDDVRSPTSTR
jgi:dTDP-4-dehydrorhamnose 3,5-epimerase